MRTLPLARTGRAVWLLLAVVVVAVVAGLVVLRPTGERPEAAPPGPRSEGHVVGIRQAPCPDTAEEAGITCRIADVRLEGGRVVEATSGISAARGDRVVVEEGVTDYVVVGLDRESPMLVLLGSAIAALIIIGLWSGLRAAVALALIVATVSAWAVPAVLDGRSPRAVAIVTAAAIAVLVGAVCHRGHRGALASVVAGGVSTLGVLAFDATASPLATPSLALVGAAVLAGAGAAVVAERTIDATWTLDAVDPAAGWWGVAAAGRRLARDGLAGATVLAGGAVLAAVTVALPPLVQGNESIDATLGTDALAAPIVVALVAVAVVPVAMLVASMLAASIVVREAGGPATDDPRRFRSRREEKVWD